MHRLLPPLLAITLLAAALLALGLHTARADPVIRRAALILPNWPAGAPPVTAALVSDIHLGNLSTDEARLTRIVAQVNALHPDVVVLAGDFVAGHQPGAAARVAPGLTAALAGFSAPLGAVAVLGNHDHWTGARAVVRALAAARIETVSNRAVRRGPLAVAGVDDAYTHHDRTAAALAQLGGIGGAPLVISHSPDIAPQLGAGTPVLLAGHTHCGQIVPPFVGPPSVPSRYGRRYLCGMIGEGTRTVIVTAGIGTSLLPLRFGAPPDLWLMTLGPARQRPIHRMRCASRRTPGSSCGLRRD